MSGPLAPVVDTRSDQCGTPSPLIPEEPFNYLETASSRAGIVAASEKLKLRSVAIIGLGGTGSYVLDQVAKTPVEAIHLFDHDIFLTHNAFRGPGAPSLGELRTKLTKVAYWGGLYSKMHRGIVKHPNRVDQSNVAELADMQFVFLCVDSGAGKKLIVEALEQYGVPFIDVGMGIELRANNSLGGILRATLSVPGRRDYFRSRVSLADPVDDGEYEDDIQVADLNALNAALAVIRWKMFYEFYDDFQDALNISLSLDTNTLLKGASGFSVGLRVKLESAAVEVDSSLEVLAVAKAAR
jgi:hypothetical protein